MLRLMAKGYDLHQQRLQELNRLGRMLARRSGSACELCQQGEVSLHAWEVPPIPDEPDLGRCIFICDACREGVESTGKLADPPRWRGGLETAMWSQVPAVQVTAVRLLRRLAEQQEMWASELLEDLYLDPAVEEWVDTP